MKSFYISLVAVFSCIFSQNVHSQTLDYSFVVLGCNRVEAADTAGNPSTANVYQLNRVFSEIAAMKPLPKYLFIAGDLILGYEKDTVKLADELKSWIQLYKQSPLAATDVKLVVIPGNHESDIKINDEKVPVAVSERVFIREMKDYIIGNNGPLVTGLLPGTDSLTTDQSRLTYSFDHKGDHFIILNTDPVGRDSRVPYHWVNNDIEKARKNNARHIFAIGHKPAYSSHFKKGIDGLDNYKANRDSLWTVLENYKCEAMITAHNHTWDTIQPHKGKTWQIIAGNGGSKLEKNWASLPNPFFGYTLVELYTDKTVKVKSYGRDVNQTTASYLDPTPNNPTTVRADFSIGVLK